MWVNEWTRRDPVAIPYLELERHLARGPSAGEEVIATRELLRVALPEATLAPVIPAGFSDVDVVLALNTRAVVYSLTHPFIYL